MIDPELAQAAVRLAALFFVGEIVVIVFSAALAWLVADCLKR